MKKGFFVLLLVLIVLVGVGYLFIPDVMTINRTVIIPANPQGLYRNLQDSHSWHAWWPGSNNSIQNSFVFHGNTYSVIDEGINSFTINITGKKMALKTFLFLFSSSPDSTQLSWQAQVPIATAPIERVQRYWASKQLHDDLDTLLKRMKTYYSEVTHVYQFPVQREMIRDSLLVFTAAVSKGYPSVSFIYTLINSLKVYAAQQNAQETGFPMLNVSTTDSVSFLTKVSIPVNKILPATATISSRKMPGRFPILLTRVTGGLYRIAQAQMQMENYLSDYRLTPVAIPFQSLLTNRLQEPDTAKWITKLYYPLVEYPNE